MNRSDIVYAASAGNTVFHLVNLMCRQLAGCRHFAKFDSCDCGKRKMCKKEKKMSPARLRDTDWVGISRITARTYALKSCLLMNTTLMPVTHAMRFRNRMPYANANIDEFNTSDGNFRSDVLSSHMPHIKFGFALRNCKMAKKRKKKWKMENERWKIHKLHMCPFSCHALKLAWKKRTW